MINRVIIYHIFSNYIIIMLKQLMRSCFLPIDKTTITEIIVAHFEFDKSLLVSGLSVGIVILCSQMLIEF